MHRKSNATASLPLRVLTSAQRMWSLLDRQFAKTEPLILAIETATRSGGVAVARGEQVLAARAGGATVSHSMNLIEMIEEALLEAGGKIFLGCFFLGSRGAGG